MGIVSIGVNCLGFWIYKMIYFVVIAYLYVGLVVALTFSILILVMLYPISSLFFKSKGMKGPFRSMGMLHKRMLQLLR